MSKRSTRVSKLASVEEDLQLAERVPQTPQTTSPAYRLAVDDADFLHLDEMRGVRLQLELMKPELIMRDRGIASTVIMFGGARIPSPEQVGKGKKRSKTLDDLSRYYDEARKFACLVSQESVRSYGHEFVITTGGGPGIMEAGNLGAQDAGAASIGLNIVLPHEQAPNAYVTPDLCFNFHYFAIRKMHFLMRAKAITIFPGGFGTLDELFEVLTLIQTKRMDPVPILLFAPEFWNSIINFEALKQAGTISPEDLDLFAFVDTAEQAWSLIQKHYGLT
ncbi:MAG: LOG family protein [Neomegalonema sp.]|nr:LOG family protein [Neomegalonema sp.]